MSDPSQRSRRKVTGVWLSPDHSMLVVTVDGEPFAVIDAVSGDPAPHIRVPPGWTPLLLPSR